MLAISEEINAFSETRTCSASLKQHSEEFKCDYNSLVTVFMSDGLYLHYKIENFNVYVVLCCVKYPPSAKRPDLVIYENKLENM